SARAARGPGLAAGRGWGVYFAEPVRSDLQGRQGPRWFLWRILEAHGRLRQVLGVARGANSSRDLPAFGDGSKPAVRGDGAAQAGQSRWLAARLRWERR